MSSGKEIGKLYSITVFYKSSHVIEWEGFDPPLYGRVSGLLTAEVLVVPLRPAVTAEQVALPHDLQDLAVGVQRLQLLVLGLGVSVAESDPLPMKIWNMKRMANDMDLN